MGKWFRFSNKSVFEQPLRTNYVQQPRFHCIIIIIVIISLLFSLKKIKTGYPDGVSSWFSSDPP
jgi:hypothetical protein